MLMLFEPGIPFFRFLEFCKKRETTTRKEEDGQKLLVPPVFVPDFTGPLWVKRVIFMAVTECTGRKKVALRRSTYVKWNAFRENGRL